MQQFIFMHTSQHIFKHNLCLFSLNISEAARQLADELKTHPEQLSWHLKSFHEVPTDLDSTTIFLFLRSESLHFSLSSGTGKEKENKIRKAILYLPM
jgi:hypothetical protein